MKNNELHLWVEDMVRAATDEYGGDVSDDMALFDQMLADHDAVTNADLEVRLAIARGVQDALRARIAEAWDEGFRQGGPMHDEFSGEPDRHTVNPYRAKAVRG